MSQAAPSSLWKQPRAVWAVAFASVVAFMGIGLVDPILPAIAEALVASETETELLFTSYLVITGAMMLFTSFVSSRIGAKRTLLAGLAIILVFSLLCALSGSVDAVIGFRAGWGLGNALFISTALATIVGSAAGGSAGAIMLYEASLGLGLAIGPLAGGLLGSVSWRAPFFGVTVLMAIAFIAVIVLLEAPATRPQPVRFTASLRALGRPALGLLAAAAVFYNMAFFVLLAYSPFPLGFDALGIGLTFFGWGVGLAVTSIWGAPALLRLVKRSTAIVIVMPLIAADLLVAGLVAAHPGALVACIVAGGLLFGFMNTILTETVMEATDLPRPIASGAYSGVRFLGGAVAPPVATLLAHHFGDVAPYLFGTIAALVTAAIVFAGRPLLRVADGRRVDAEDEALAVTEGDAA
ncbi:MFS transporter [Microbacterium sp. ZXX196]|uniref:MFS transporter n=1 Tax=Microbacterium sp. ZXX196 TaxID=2609291 RepID=UPI0012B9DBA7|nr:MFS transporter [Microbacterium sp. ZXX196]MTE24762.1 MFS transporter [Microbacterium sp. ZXX196]